MSIVWPVPDHHATSSLFAEWPQWRKDMGLQRHSGLDIPAPQGAVLVAGVAGAAVAGENASAGQWVRIDVERRAIHDIVGDAHPDTPDRLALFYMHLSRYQGAYPREVQAGEILGFVGTTGASTGPHLHLSVYRHLRGQWWLSDPALELADAPLGTTPFLDPTTRRPLYV